MLTPRTRVPSRLAISPCRARAAASAGAKAADDEVAAYKRAVDESFAEWLAALWPDAEAMGVSRAVFDANVKGLKLDWSLPHLVYPDPAVAGGPPLAQGSRRSDEAEPAARVRASGRLFQPDRAQRARGDRAQQDGAAGAAACGHPEAVQRAGLDRRRHLGARDGLRQGGHAVRRALRHRHARFHGTADRRVPQRAARRARRSCKRGMRRAP